MRIQPVKRTNNAIGWHDSHCASAALLSGDGHILFAAAEERFSKRKTQKGRPTQALAEIERRFINHQANVVYVDQPLADKVKRNLALTWSSWKNGLNCSKSPGYLAGTALARLSQGHLNGIAGEHDGDELESAGQAITFDALCEHHTAHAASAYYLSGFDEAHVLTIDGVGDCLSGSIFEGRHGRLLLKHQFFYNELTVGADYETLTALLGFNPDRHCGKITGLAAFGTHNETCIAAVRAFFTDAWRAGNRNWFDRMHGVQSEATLAELRSLRESHFGAFTREDLAYAIQYLSEQRVVEIIREHISPIANTNIALAGGVFANVRINQKVKELGFRNIFVQPAMDDGGLALGAALNHLSEQNGSLAPYRLPDVFLGPAFTDDEIAEALEQAGLKCERTGDIAATVAQLIADRKVVARFDGAMEFGPRALGNRSILYDTRDPSVNKWLNQRLRRTEFMPFAPATLAEHADECYQGIAGCEHTAEFMTITFDCTEFMKSASPAVVHVDGTARAQFVTESANPGFHEIIREYHKLTGIPSVVNTSFNMHEAPIVCTPADAILSFQQSHLDYLAIGPFLVARQEVPHRQPSTMELAESQVR